MGGKGRVNSSKEAEVCLGCHIKQSVHACCCTGSSSFVGDNGAYLQQS